MNAGHANMGRITRIRENNAVVFEPELRQSMVAGAPVSQNLRTSLGNVANERHKVLGGHIRYPTHSHTPKPLRRMHIYRKNHDFLLCATASPFVANVAAVNGGNRS